MNSFQTERNSGHYYVYGMAGEVSVILFKFSIIAQVIIEMRAF